MYIKGRDFRWNKNATANYMLPVRSLLKYRDKWMKRRSMESGIPLYRKLG